MPKSSRPEGPQQYISVSARHGSSVHCTWLISRDYRKCRMLLHELFAKLHDVNITPSTFLRISIGYRCVAESTTRLQSSVKSRQTATTFVSYWSTLVIQTVACSEVIYVRPIVNTLCNITRQRAPELSQGQIWGHKVKWGQFFHFLFCLELSSDIKFGMKMWIFSELLEF